MKTILKIVEEYKNKRDGVTKAFEKFIMDQIFGELPPEDEKLGKRVRVKLKNIEIKDAIGPSHIVTIDPDYKDVVSSYTREVSVDAKITLVFPEDRSWKEREKEIK